jgi:uncharacterized protein (DUF952 family)
LILLHVCTREEWNDCLSHPWYKPKNFERDGFVHCCLENQLEGVLERYFVNRRDLILLTVDEQELEAELKYERGEAKESFPHIYGVINRDAIVNVENISEEKTKKPPQVDL